MTADKLPDRRKGMSNKLQLILTVLSILSILGGFSLWLTTSVNNTVERVIKEHVLTEEQVQEIAITAAETVIENHEIEVALESAEAVLQTLVANDILSPNEISTFLANKPAGRTDLLKGVTNDVVYQSLLETYGDLAKNAKIALDH